MLNKYILSIFMVFTLMIAACTSADAQVPDNKAKMSKEQILDLLHRVGDMRSEKEMQNFKRLLEMGENVYPVLSEKLFDAGEPYSPAEEYFTNRIMIIFIESKGDKTIPLKAVRKFIKKWTEPKTYTGEGWQRGTAENMRSLAARALGEFSMKEDNAILLSLLNDPCSGVQSASLDALAKIGDEKVLQEVEKWLVKRKATESQNKREEQDKDWVIRNAEKAIETFRARLKKPTQTEPNGKEEMEMCRK